MNESHDSLQYEYEVTCPELDFVVQEGRKIDGVIGIRMTGAGFGGCTVAIIKEDDINNYIELTYTEVSKYLYQIQQLIRDKKIVEYGDLMDLLADNDCKELWDVAKTHTIFLNTYISSRRYKTKQEIVNDFVKN